MMRELCIAVLLGVTASVLSGGSPRQDASLVVGERSPLEGELEMTGRVETISVSPDGRIWMTSFAGQLAVTDSVMGAWRFSLDYFGGHLDYRRPPPHFKRVAFFTRDTAIAVGRFVPGEYSPTAPHALLRTVDGGVTWDTVSYGTAAMIYDVHVGLDGEAWMGGSDGRLLVTKDRGATWEQRTPPFDASRRLAAIFMESSKLGVAGALGNAIRETRDGGVTWSDLPTPKDHGLVVSDQRYEIRIEDLIIFQGWLLARQGGRVFATRRGSDRWRPLGTDLPVIEVAIDRDRSALFGITDDRSVVAFDDDLTPRPFGATRLQADPVEMAIHDGAVYVLDTEGAVYRISESRTEYSFPLSGDPREAMTHVRVTWNALWGTTAHHIYRSVDGGETWDRVGFTPFTIEAFEIVGDDRLLLWDGHGRNGLFDRREGTLTPVATLDGYDIVGVKRVKDTWFAYGGRRYESRQAFFGVHFRGSRENGFVLVSRDWGMTWTLVDEWFGGGVANMHVVEGSGDLLLVSYLGSIRRIARSGEGSYVGTDLLSSAFANRGEFPYFDEARVVFLDANGRGFIDGWRFHGGRSRYETTDGGTTWRRAPRPRRHFDRAVWTPNGYVAVLTSAFDPKPHGELYLLSPDSEDLVYRAGPSAIPISDLSWFHGTNVLLALDESRFVLVDTSTGEMRRARPSNVR
jgi:hypothetical protein